MTTNDILNFKEYSLRRWIIGLILFMNVIGRLSNKEYIDILILIVPAIIVFPLTSRFLEVYFGINFNTKKLYLITGIAVLVEIIYSSIVYS